MINSINIYTNSYKTFNEQNIFNKTPPDWEKRKTGISTMEFCKETLLESGILTSRPSSVSTCFWRFSDAFRVIHDQHQLMKPKSNHIALINGLAQEYMKLKAEVQANFTGNEYYRQMSSLNGIFESVLRVSIVLIAHGTPEEGYGTNARNLQDKMLDNMKRHMSNFFEKFINNIQSMDFDTAFSKSMEPILNSETTSLDCISYLDILRWYDAQNEGYSRFRQVWGLPPEFGENFILWSFHTFVNDKNASEVLRREIAILLGFVNDDAAAQLMGTKQVFQNSLTQIDAMRAFVESFNTGKRIEFWQGLLIFN